MEPHAKGQTLKSVLMYVQKTLPPEALDRFMAELDPADRAVVEAGILPTSTFPMSLVNRLTTAGARVANKPLPQFAREVGRFSASEGVKGVYRLFARVLTPEALLGKAASMWSAMNSVGRMEVVPQGSGTALIRLHDYPAEPVMCLRIVGWVEQLAELTGAKNAAVTHQQCVTKGAQSCEWRVTW